MNDTTNSQVDPSTNAEPDFLIEQFDIAKIVNEGMKKECPEVVESASNKKEEKKEESKIEVQGAIETSNQPETTANKKDEDESKNGAQEEPPPEKPIDVLTVEVDTRNPQQNLFEFTNVGITISSMFDSGNLARCTQNDADPYHFHMHLSGDALPYANVGHYKTWFYFSVKGIKSGDTLTFNVRNMAQQGKLYKAGLKPVFRIMPQNKKWKRCGGTVTWAYKNDGFELTWTHHFNVFNSERDDTAYFAWTYPYSFEETLKKTRKMLKRFENHESIYIVREVLYYSREHRPMELVTFTDKCGMTEEREETIEGLFPEHSTVDETKMRPFKFDKPTIFLSCRVHPGETPASYVLNGILNFITNEKSDQAKVLRERFVFKVVPCLNPDGVYRGYFRLDTLGQNLNRYYIKPSSDRQPTIFAVKAAIEQQSKCGKLKIYADLHAHASKRGCFMFGNSLTGEAQLQNMLLPKLVSLNSLNFDFMECSFSDKLMQCKDKKDGLTREGCGRVSIMKLTEIPNCYTLECNYASGRRVNHISNKLNLETGQQEPEIPITDSKSKFYQENCLGQNANGTVSTLKQSPAYTIEVFEDIGRAFCLGLLDFFECNTISRLPLSIYKSVEGVKTDILSHNPIFLPKKRDAIEENKNTKKGNPSQRIGLNSKAMGTRSQQQTKSLQRNQTQRGQLSAAPTATGDTSQSTSVTAINSSFANRLSQKQAAMVKQNSQVSETDGKTILNSVRSKQQDRVSADTQGKFKSAQQPIQPIQVQEGKELKNFVRQLKPPKQNGNKNPNLNQNNRTIFQQNNHKTAPGSSKNPNAQLLTRSEKNFKGAPYQGQKPFPIYYQHMQQQNDANQLNMVGENEQTLPFVKGAEIQPRKPKRKNYDHPRHQQPGCSDFSSCGSQNPSIYEHEDDIMYQRQHIQRTRHSSESQRRLQSLNSSDGFSDSSASAGGDQAVKRSDRKKLLAKQALPPSRAEAPEQPEKSVSPLSRTTLSPNLVTQSARQSMYNKPTPPPIKNRMNQDNSEVAKEVQDQLFATDDNLMGKLAKQNQLSNASHKRKNSDKTKRKLAMLQQQEENMMINQFLPKPHKIKSHHNHEEIVRSCSQAGENHQQKQNLSEVCPRDATHFEDESQFKTNEDGISQSLLPATRGMELRHAQNRLKHQNSSSINASEYASQQGPMPHVSYNAQLNTKRQKIRPENQNHRPVYHEPTYRFDRGNSDLVKSIAQSTTQTTNTQQPGQHLHGISTKSSFTGGFLKQGLNVAVAHQELDAQTLQEEAFTRQQFSLMKKLINKPLKTNARGHSMNKKAESIEQTQFIEEFGPPREFMADHKHRDTQLQKLLKEQQRNSCAADKRRRTSESQKHQNNSMKTNSASHTSAKYKQFYNRKPPEGTSLGNGSQATISHQLGGLMVGDGFTSPEASDSTQAAAISGNQREQMNKKYQNQNRNKNVKMTGSGPPQKPIQNNVDQQSVGIFTYFRMPTPPEKKQHKSNQKKTAGGVSSQSPSTGAPSYHLPGTSCLQEQQLLMHQAQQHQFLLGSAQEQAAYPGIETEESLFPQISQQSSQNNNPAINVQVQGPVASFSTLRKNAHKRQHQASTMTQPQQALLLNQNRSLSLLGNQGVVAPTCAFPAQFTQPQMQVAQARSMSNNVPKPSTLNRQSKSPNGNIGVAVPDQKVEFQNKIEPISDKAAKYAVAQRQSHQCPAAAARRKRNTLQLAKEASQRMILDQNMQVEGTQQSQLYADPSTSQFFQNKQQKQFGPPIAMVQRGPPLPDNWKSSSQKY